MKAFDVDARNGTMNNVATTVQAAVNHNLNSGGLVAEPCAGIDLYNLTAEYEKICSLKARDYKEPSAVLLREKPCVTVKK